MINDTYNSNPLSSYALESLCEVFLQEEKLQFLVDMNELGELVFFIISRLVSLLLREILRSYCSWRYGTVLSKGSSLCWMKADKIMIFDDKMALALYLRETYRKDVVLARISSHEDGRCVQRLISEVKKCFIILYSSEGVCLILETFSIYYF